MHTIFFKTFNNLVYFSLNLHSFAKLLVCWNCGSTDHFVSHGFIKKGKGDVEITGKRLLCDIRHKGGCGATTRLVVADKLPRFHYGATFVVAFFKALAEGLAIAKAYQDITGACTPRNAWRWARKARNQMSVWRTRLSLAGMGPHPKADESTSKPVASPFVNPLDSNSIIPELAPNPTIPATTASIPLQFPRPSAKPLCSILGISQNQAIVTEPLRDLLQKPTIPTATASLRETLTDLFKLTAPALLCFWLQCELQQALI